MLYIIPFIGAIALFFAFSFFKRSLAKQKILKEINEEAPPTPKEQKSFFLKVKNLSGRVFDMEANPDDTGEQLINKIAEKYQYSSTHIVRLVHKKEPNGAYLLRDKTIKEQNLKSGDEIFVVFEERIGDFGIGNFPGSHILEDFDNYTPSSEEVSQLIRDVYVEHGYEPFQADKSQESEEVPYRLVPDLLTKDQRETLMKYLNERYKGENDLKFKLTPEELISLIGKSAFEKMQEAYGTSVDEIWLRRAQMDGMEHQGINWHVDHSTRTMQVALNGDSEYKGGKLLFAYKGKIIAPERLPGTATIHDHRLVHGVTPLKSSPRFGLFFLHLPK